MFQIQTHLFWWCHCYKFKKKKPSSLIVNEKSSLKLNSQCSTINYDFQSESSAMLPSIMPTEDSLIKPQPISQMEFDQMVIKFDQKLRQKDKIIEKFKNALNANISKTKTIKYI